MDQSAINPNFAPQPQCFYPLPFKNFFDPNDFGLKTKFWSEKKFDPKKLWLKKNLGQKQYFGLKKIFGP